jgi:phosphoribosylformimino-5-aminoimidazole carboxamide ribotide isomerase
MIDIIPAIDIIDGRCVRLEQGDYRLKKVYEQDPLDMARRFEDHGIKRLHLVDLDGARAKHVVNFNTLEKIASKTSQVIDFGGGIKSDKDLQIVFSAGAAMAVVGSVAVTDRDLFQSWLQKHGPGKIILGADVKEGMIAVSGWTDITELGLFDFITYYRAMGVTQVLCTDIAKDGMLQGSSMNLYEQLVADFPDIQIIASGGVSSVKELHQLNSIGMSGAIIGKALYEGRITLAELKPFLC